MRFRAIRRCATPSSRAALKTRCGFSALCPSIRCDRFIRPRRPSSSRRFTRASGCRRWKPWRAERRWFARNVSSLPEVVGDAAEIVNPENVFDIARGMREVLLNRRRRSIDGGARLRTGAAIQLGADRAAGAGCLRRNRVVQEAAALRQRIPVPLAPQPDDAGFHHVAELLGDGNRKRFPIGGSVQSRRRSAR